jgi:hypothetical protein
MDSPAGRAPSTTRSTRTSRFGGLRLYISDSPATLRETDRRYFHDACVRFLAGARTC